MLRGHQRLSFYLECARAASRRYDCTVRAYVLMTNHAHILVTPSQKDTLSRFMQHIGRRYVQYFNFCYRRTGTLWEGRYKASLVETERYVLTCYRYIELNPVRAGMVPIPLSIGGQAIVAMPLMRRTRLLFPTSFTLHWVPIHRLAVRPTESCFGRNSMRQPYRLSANV